MADDNTHDETAAEGVTSVLTAGADTWKKKVAQKLDQKRQQETQQQK